MKKGISLATIYGPGRDDRKYRLEVWTQPWSHWLIAEAYHWYDMRIYKARGFRKLERWLESRHKTDDTYVPLSCQMDIRCSRLTERNRTVVATIEVTKENYCKIKQMMYHRTCSDAE